MKTYFDFNSSALHNYDPVELMDYFKIKYY